MTNLPSWDHLRSLLEVARTGTLSGAAVRLGLMHSTVSRHITALEEATQTKIIDRTPAGVSLTSAGERLLEAAEAAENSIHLAHQDIANEGLSAGGTVRIGVPDAVGAFFLAPRLPALLKAHPNLTVQLVATSREFNLTKREADLAIVLSAPRSGRLTRRKLADYTLGVYASQDYLTSSSPIHVANDMRGHQFVNYIDDLIFTPELDYLDEVVKGANASLQSSNLIAQMNAARAHAGLVVLPHFLASQFSELVPVLPDQIRLERSWWLVVHNSQIDIARIRIAIDFIADLFRAHRTFLFPNSIDRRSEVGAPS